MWPGRVPSRLELGLMRPWRVGASFWNRAFFILTQRLILDNSTSEGCPFFGDDSLQGLSRNPVAFMAYKHWRHYATPDDDAKSGLSVVFPCSIPVWGSSPYRWDWHLLPRTRCKHEMANFPVASIYPSHSFEVNHHLFSIGDLDNSVNGTSWAVQRKYRWN